MRKLQIWSKNKNLFFPTWIDVLEFGTESGTDAAFVILHYICMCGKNNAKEKVRTINLGTNLHYILPDLASSHS